MDKIKELKATAYDILANIEYLQRQLADVNQQIANLQKEQDGKAGENS